MQRENSFAAEQDDETRADPEALALRPRAGDRDSRRQPRTWVSVRSGDRSYKLWRRDGSEFVAVYDLASDPAESVDLHDPAAPKQQALLDRLQAYRQSLIDGYLRWADHPDLLSDQERIELLRSLGYLR